MAQRPDIRTLPGLKSRASSSILEVLSSKPRPFTYSIHDGANGNSIVTALQYVQNVKDLLSRVSADCKGGNFTGAEDLARIAYVDNFEYIETELLQRNAKDLKEQTEELLRVELVALIRDKADSDSIDGEIPAINAKLDEAIVIVPELPPVLAMAMLALIITIVILSARYKGKNGLCSLKYCRT